MVYETNTKSSEGAYHAHGHLIASGPTHIRYSVKASGFAPMLFIYDGQRLLVHDTEFAKPWSLYEAADEHPEQLGFVSGLFSDPHSVAFATSCPSASTVGHQAILGHTADGYHCAKKKHADGSVDVAEVIWLDRATHLLLKVGPTHVTQINEHPTIDAATFSTKPPVGANVAVYRAQGQPGAGS